MGLDLAVWPDEAGWGCTRRGIAAGLAQQLGIIPPLPAAAFFWKIAAGRRRVGSRHSSHGGRNFAIAEIEIYWSFKNYPEPKISCSE